MGGERWTQGRGWLLPFFAAIVLAAPVSSAADITATAEITEYPLDSISPNDLTLGPDGNIWVSTLEDIVKVRPDGSKDVYPPPVGSGLPIGIGLGTDGDLWYGMFDKPEIGRVSIDGAFGALPLLTPTRRAGGLTLGDDGNVWFVVSDTDPEFESQVGRITPGGIVSEFVVAPDSFVASISRGPDDGNIWFSKLGEVGRITPTGVVTKFPIDAVDGLVAGEDGKLWYTAIDIGRLSTDGEPERVGEVRGSPGPFKATLGPDGNLWMVGSVYYSDTRTFTEYLWRMTPNGNLTELTGLRPGAFTVGLAAGADGSLWFIDQQAGRIGKTPALTFDERNLQAGSAPEAMARGADGSVWFTAPGRRIIGRIDALGGTVQLPLAEGIHPDAIAVDAGGNGWFTDSARNSLTRITPGGDTSERFLDTEFAGPLGISAAPSGELWFTEFDSGKIGRLANGEITEFSPLTPSSNPQDIVALADGTVWFTERGANNIGRRAADGTMTEFPIPTEGSGPYDIAAAANGDLWFTEYNVAQIARITPAGVITEFPIPESTRFLAVGGDGAIWFGLATRGRLARMTTRGRVTEFVLPVTKGFPDGITDAPGGNLFFGVVTADQILSTHLAAADPYTPACYGDCDNDGRVGASDVRFGVRIALGGVPAEFCSSLRRFAAGVPEVDALVHAVAESLGECRA